MASLHVIAACLIAIVAGGLLPISYGQSNMSKELLLCSYNVHRISFNVDCVPLDIKRHILLL
jgi:hypothetical protein